MTYLEQQEGLKCLFCQLTKVNKQVQKDQSFKRNFTYCILLQPKSGSETDSDNAV